MQTERPSTTADAAYAAIRKMLLSSELKPGQRVSQTLLAERIGCSTVPVMVAMRRLQSEGFLTKEPRRMASVRSWSVDELECSYLIREGLEPITARRCAERITDAEIEQLRQLSDQYDDAARTNDFERCLQLEIEIHDFIANCADCALLASELKRLAVVQQTAGRALNEHIVQQTYPYAHRAIVEAIADHDADMAEYLMRKHIRRGYENVRQCLLEKEANADRKRPRRRKKS